MIFEPPHAPEPLTPLVVAALRDLADRCNQHNGFVSEPEKTWAVQYLRALRFTGNERLDAKEIENWAETEGGWSEHHAKALRKIVEGVNENRRFRDYRGRPIQRDAKLERELLERWADHDAR